MRRTLRPSRRQGHGALCLCAPIGATQNHSPLHPAVHCRNAGPVQERALGRSPARALGRSPAAGRASPHAASPGQTPPCKHRARKPKGVKRNLNFNQTSFLKSHFRKSVCFSLHRRRPPCCARRLALTVARQPQKNQPHNPVCFALHHTCCAAGAGEGCLRPDCRLACAPISWAVWLFRPFFRLRRRVGVDAVLRHIRFFTPALGQGCLCRMSGRMSTVFEPPLHLPLLRNAALRAVFYRGVWRAARSPPLQRAVDRSIVAQAAAFSGPTTGRAPRQKRKACPSLFSHGILFAVTNFQTGRERFNYGKNPRHAGKTKGQTVLRLDHRAVLHAAGGSCNRHLSTALAFLSSRCARI